MEHLKQETTSGAQLNLDALYQVCPQCFTESKDPKTGEIKHTVDFEKLRLLLGDNIAEGDERYDFTWVGKRAALQEAAKPIRKTLRPCPEESVDWDNTKNLYIEGDNIEVLKILQNSYMGKIKMIYIDPPYNTGNDSFVYPDNYTQDKNEYDLFVNSIDEEGNRFRKNNESNGRFHSDWCSMIYMRLLIARSLLTDDGVLLVSIDDCEGSNMINICNEVFGEKNKVTTFIWNCSTAGGIRPKHTSKTHEYVFVYAKDIDRVPTLWAPLSGDAQKMYTEKDEKGLYRSKEFVFKNASTNENQKYEITCPDGEIVTPKSGYIYRFVPETFEAAKKDNLVVFKKTNSSSTLINKNGEPAKWNIFIKKYFGDGLGCPSTTLPKDMISMYNKGTQDVQALFNNQRVFENVKPVTLISYLAQVFSAKESIVLDFFSGSSTTAHAIMQLNSEDNGNRHFIMIQIPEPTDENSDAFKAGFKNICEIGKERIRRAGKLILEEQQSKKDDLFSADLKPIDVGFRVFKCADSNMKDVYYAPAEYTQELLLGLEDNIKEDRNDLDLLFGCMLDWGVTLDLPLRTEKVDGVTIHIVNEGDLVACFDQNISEAAIDQIATLLPMRVVLRDNCFKEAKEKMNFFELFKQRTGWSEDEVRKNVKVI